MKFNHFLLKMNLQMHKLYSLDELQEIISLKLEEEIFNSKPEPNGLYEPIRYLLALGGKRIRPALTLMAFNMYSEKIENAIDAAIALEVFHNFTLMHDDIMDNAEMRRGKTTVHIKYNTNTAILSGDAMMVLANQYIAKTPVEVLKPVFEVFNQTAMEVCEGQQYDMNFETLTQVSESEYIKMIRLKTSVLLAGALKIGAIIGGADQADTEALYRFGVNLGLAFQIKDDYLDVFGDERVFGKKIGGDILANKKTFLLIKALETAQGTAKDRLLEQISTTEAIPEEKIKLVTDIYRELNIDNVAKEKMNYFYTNAMLAFEQIKVNELFKTELRKLTGQLIERNN